MQWTMHSKDHHSFLHVDSPSGLRSFKMQQETPEQTHGMQKRTLCSSTAWQMRQGENASWAEGEGGADVQQQVA